MNEHQKIGFATPIKLNQIKTFQTKIEQMNRLGILDDQQNMIAFLTAMVKCCDILIDAKSNGEEPPFLKIQRREFQYNRIRVKQEEKVRGVENNLRIERDKLKKMDEKHQELEKERLDSFTTTPGLMEEIMSLQIESKVEQKKIDDEYTKIRKRELEVMNESKKLIRDRKLISDEREELNVMKEFIMSKLKATDELLLKEVEIEEKMLKFNEYVEKEKATIEIYKKMMAAHNVDFEMVPPDCANSTKYDLFSFINERNLWAEFKAFKSKRILEKYERNLVKEKKENENLLKPITIETKVVAKVESLMIKTNNVDIVILEDLREKFKAVKIRMIIIRGRVKNFNDNRLDHLESLVEQFERYENLSDEDLCVKRIPILNEYVKIISLIDRF